MSTDLFLNLLISSTIITIISAEALKRLLNATRTPYRANAIALDMAMISSVAVSVWYRRPFGLGFESVQVFRLLALIIFTWFLSMYVFDKIAQYVEQHNEVKRIKKGEDADEF